MVGVKSGEDKHFFGLRSEKKISKGSVTNNWY